MRITEKELYKMLERVNSINTRDLKLSINKKGGCYLYEEYEDMSIFQITPTMSLRDMSYFLLGMKTSVIGWAI
nr:MAG TPA: hypothetical protein [Caudoviricetes sp.]